MKEDEIIFNYWLSRARRVIENTFVILVARWRLFRGAIRASRDNVVKYAMTTVCLHNYLQQTENAVYCPTGFVHSENSNKQIMPGEWRKVVASDSGTGLISIPKVRGSRYTVNTIALRETLKHCT